MPSTTLRSISKKDFDLVGHIQVSADQAIYAGTIRQAFDTVENAVDFHAVFAGTRAVGFFKIDRGFGTNNGFARDGELGLRAFKIDSTEQGKGFGVAAARALQSYLPHRYPAALSVVLTVNLANPAAYACYRKAGFTDTGELFTGGLAGPQHIMRMALR
jgi:RimJ/RimL family protein N-acetyltransferase